MFSRAKNIKIIGKLLSGIRLKLLSLQNRKVSNVIGKVIAEGLSYLDVDALCDLVQAVISNERKHINGIIVEAGCALGGSAIVIASAKSKDRELLIYDVFDMIPPPSGKNGQDVRDRYEIIKSGKARGPGGEPYYGYEKKLYSKVLRSFTDFGLEVNNNNIKLIKGLFRDTLRISSPVALAHIDCDWYDSVLTCLNQIEPHLIRGGVMIIDDYYAWSGCKRAVEDYFRNREKSNYYFVKKSRLHIIKK